MAQAATKPENRPPSLPRALAGAGWALGQPAESDGEIYYLIHPSGYQISRSRDRGGAWSYAIWGPPKKVPDHFHARELVGVFATPTEAAGACGLVDE